MSEIIRQRIVESISVKQSMLADGALLAQLKQVSGDCIDALRQGGKVMFAGNGGSFADAQHLAAEFTSRLLFDRSPLPALALGTNSSAMSAIGNDYGYHQVFARELRGIAKPQDIFIGLSTSGNSPNLLAAIDQAQELGLRHMAWTGRTGGELDGRCECLKVPSTETPRIQECHILLGHILCELVESHLFSQGPR
jgi:D-sedoheptulose 7-phosphate isomerase